MLLTTITGSEISCIEVTEVTVKYGQHKFTAEYIVAILERNYLFLERSKHRIDTTRIKD